MIAFDDRDAALLVKRRAARDELSQSEPLPLAGDVALLSDGTRRRVAYVWGPDSVQLSSGEGSHHFNGSGSMSYSGGLVPGIPAAHMRRVGTTTARAWFFHHDCPGASRGVDCEARVTLWQVTEGAA